MLKPVSKILLIMLALSFAFSVQAEEIDQKQVERNDEGKVIYQMQYDYDAISGFLGMDRIEYDQYWMIGLSIAEMANNQGIARRDLVGYIVSLHYKEMKKWKAKGDLSEEDYFDLVYRLEDEIKWFIDHKSE